MNTTNSHSSTPQDGEKPTLSIPIPLGQQPNCDNASLRILIVDDNREIRILVAKMATHLGYCVATAEDALSAFRKLEQEYYDVVVTDYNMPFMNGYQLAERIKETHFGTKVILMTGCCKEGIMDMMGTGSGVDDLIFKPFDMRTIKEKIESVR